MQIEPQPFLPRHLIQRIGQIERIQPRARAVRMSGVLQTTGLIQPLFHLVRQAADHRHAKRIVQKRMPDINQTGRRRAAQPPLIFHQNNLQPHARRADRREHARAAPADNAHIRFVPDGYLPCRFPDRRHSHAPRFTIPRRPRRAGAPSKLIHILSCAAAKCNGKAQDSPNWLPIIFFVDFCPVLYYIVSRGDKNDH